MKILVIKPSSLGDIIHALPFLKAVKDTFPDAAIDWVISKNLKGMLDDHPLINELIIFNKDAWKNVRNIPGTLSDISSLRNTLRSRHYDIVVDLQGLLRSGLVAFSASRGLKVGFEDAREGSRFFYDKKVPAGESVHAVDRCLEVAKAIGSKVGKPEFPLYISNSARDRIKTLLGNISEYIVIAPSARWLTKRWPSDNFASLIQKITIPCVITGTQGDSVIVHNIKNSLPAETANSNRIINACGKTDLKELIALIGGAKAVVSNDSGPVHIAAALNIPVVAIFGPTDPFKTGPYGWQENKNMSVIRANVPCSPCRNKKCGDLICMNSLSVESVYKALKKYL